MYYTTIQVKADPGHASEAIDATIEAALGTLNKEAGCPVVLVNVIPVSLPSCLCLTIMAKPYEPPVRLAEVRGVQIDDALIRTKSRFL